MTQNCIFLIFPKNFQNFQGISCKTALNTSFKVPGVFLNIFFIDFDYPDHPKYISDH